MANNCCGDSIYNKQKSIIPVPNCAPECPTDLGCQVITPATCVSIIPSIYCLELGDNLQDALSVITDAICNIIPPSGYSYTVGVDANDTCPGYLADKITSTCLDVTTLSVSGCKSVNIEPKALEWKNLVLSSGWITATGYQPPQYALDCNGKVWFRGTCVTTNSIIKPIDFPATGPFDGSTQTDDLSPLYIRELTSAKLLQVKGIGYNQMYQLEVNVTFNTNGSTLVWGGYKCWTGEPSGPSTVYVFLDGFSYELN